MKKNVVKVLLKLMSITKVLIMVTTIALTALLVIYKLNDKSSKAYNDNVFWAEITYKGEATIFGLKEKIDSEKLFIPAKLGKYNVTKIGKPSYSSEEELENITRYYIPATTKTVLYDFFNNSNDNIQIFYTGEVKGIIDLLTKSVDENRNIKTYIPGNYYDEYFNNNTNYYENHIFKANVIYYMNCLEDDYYYVDYYENDQKIEYQPPRPLRNNYQFDGWYLEANCVNRWNFDNDVLKVTEEMQEVKLYAKWTKVKSVYINKMERIS